MGVPQPELVLIAAIAEANRVIGQGGKVPWKIPEDSRRFRQLTLGHPIIMGRKTWVRDLEERPLDQRHNIVVSTTLPLRSQPGQLSIVRSLAAGLAIASPAEKIFIIGGASLYAEALPRVDRLELTWVAGDFPGDTYFPDLAPLLTTEFERVQQEAHDSYRFETYRRISKSF